MESASGVRLTFSMFYSCLVFLVLSNLRVVQCFNVDTINYVRHRGEPGSMFGFSVAEHKERGYSWVLVGAPEAETRQPGVTRGGAVYRCDINRDDACQEVVFDANGNQNNSVGNQMDQKSYQWFGATVKSSGGDDARVVACAPRYVYFSSAGTRRDPVGTCFVASKEFSEITEYPPCRTRNWGYHRQGSCQAGLGADFSKNGKRLYIGAVGSWYWQGQIFSQSQYNRPDVISTNEGPAADDDSYLGYSVVSGDFGGGYGQTDVAAGMPRGAGLLGKVVLYTWNMTNLQNITGEQLGAYFGYSLCAVDIDGDHLDDLVIGAPLYTDFSNNEGFYETGRVYFVYQGRESYRFRQKWHVRDGKNSKSRFGLAVASLGDINRDGYGDVAVGAPYDGPLEQGAVYIYHGSPDGIREKPSQIVTAEQISSPHIPVSTFGFSLAGGHDLDNNQYPDLVIGAYDSDTTIFLRARPVVKMKANVNFNVESKQVILEELNCTLKDLTWVPCLSLDACLEYSGIGVDDSLDFDIQLILDSKKTKSPRMYFLSDEGRNLMNQSLRLTKNSPLCKSMFVYLKPGIRDKLTVLEAEMKYSLRGEAHWAAQSIRSGRRQPRSLFPILDHNEPLMRKDSVSIQKNCGKDNICIPDLRLTATPSVKRYLLGSGERLMIDVYVENDGEDSFESILDMSVPQGMNYVNIERIDTEREIPVQCSAPSFLNNFTLHCDIGNPLPREKHIHFKVLLQPYHKEGMKSKYEFAVSVNSTNPENKTSVSDNSQTFSVPIWVETDIVLSGSSQPEDIHYNTSLYTAINVTQESEIGPQVVHTYSIRNKGPSDILQAETLFLWPSYTLAGDHLLYLLEQPQTSGPIKCEFVENVNEEHVRLDKKRKAYLQTSSFGIQSGLTSSSGSGLTIEQSSSSSSSSGSSGGSSFSSSSSSSSSKSSSSNASSGGRRGGSKITSKKIELTAEERRRLEEVERRREEEELLAETGDGSYRHSKRVKESKQKSDGNAAQTSGEVTNRFGGTRNRAESSSGSSNRGYETHISERGRVETSGSSRGGAAYGSGTTDNSGRRVEEEIARSYGASGGVYRQQGSANGNAEPGVPNRTGSAGAYDSRRTDSSYAQSGGYGNRDFNLETSESRRNQFGGGGGNTRAQVDYTGSTHNVNVIPDEDKRVYSKEEHHFKNSTWNSRDGGAPRTYSTSSWSVNNNGSVRNGTSNDFNEHGGAIKHDLHSLGVDGASSGGHTRVYTSEENKQRNTSWNSASGGRPITHETTNWRIDENGNVRNGSYSNVYEEGSVQRGSGSGGSVTNAAAGNAEYESRYGAASSSSSSNQYGAAGKHALSAGAASYDRTSGQHAASSGSSYDRTSGSAYDRTSGQYGGHQSASSSLDRGRGSSSSSPSAAGAAAAGGGASMSSQFDSLGAIARGPSDGHARTYSFDVANANEGAGGSRQEQHGGQDSRRTQSSGGNAQYENEHREHWSAGGGSGSSSSGRQYSSAHSGGSGGYNVDWRQQQSAGEHSASAGATGDSVQTQDGSYSSSSYHHRDYSSQHGGGEREYGQDDGSGVQAKFKLYPRYRREVDASGQVDLDKSLQCGPTKCTKIKCMIGSLKRDQEVWVAFRSRVWVQTLKKFAYNPEVQLSSLVGGRVTQLPHIGAPDQTSVHTREVATKVQPRESGTRPEIVPLWVVVLSACAGAIILMLLVYLLYKCGFFKRNRPSDAPEKEPLNRNGHYQSGDEAL